MKDDMRKVNELNKSVLKTPFIRAGRGYAQENNAVKLKIWPFFLPPAKNFCVGRKVQGIKNILFPVQCDVCHYN